MTEEQDRINMDADQRVDAEAVKLIEQYAGCDADSKVLNKRRSEIREKAEKLGYSSLEFQEAVRKSKVFTKQQRVVHDRNVKRLVDLVEGRQAELWPEETAANQKKAERKKQREKDAAAKAGKSGAPDPDTNPRSNPNAGGAKPKKPGDVKLPGEADPDSITLNDPAAEQAEGAEILKEGLKETRSQSEIAADLRAKAGVDD